MSQLNLPIYQTGLARRVSEPFASIAKEAEKIPFVSSRPVRHWLASQALSKMLVALRGG